MNAFDYLLDYGYFTYEELVLVIAGWGENKETYDRICQVRYAMDSDQLATEDEIILEYF